VPNFFSNRVPFFQSHGFESDEESQRSSCMDQQSLEQGLWQLRVLACVRNHPEIDQVSEIFVDYVINNAIFYTGITKEQQELICKLSNSELVDLIVLQLVTRLWVEYIKNWVSFNLNTFMIMMATAKPDVSSPSASHQLRTGCNIVSLPTAAAITN
jgi:hypothetical protein